MKQTLAALCLTFLLGNSTAMAAPPTTMTYQGYLTGNNNAPLNAPVAMTLSLYSAPTGGAPLWSEHQTGVPVANGVYSVLMGTVTPINLPFDTVYYLGVAIGSDPEMTPRQELSSLPYAFRAMTADRLNQVCADGYVLKYSAASASWDCAVPAGLQGPTGLPGLTGPQGIQGIQGIAGTNGLDGKTVLNGAGSPIATAAAGAVGDFYIDTANNMIYGPKTGADWIGIVGVSLVGPQGVAGTTNASGITSGTLAIAYGGTGANSAASARTNLGLATVASSGNYADLSGQPVLATVAASGSYTDLTNRPTLGTAAALNVGTAANNVVQLNGSARLPAVDGSQLTNTRNSDGNWNTLMGTSALAANTTGNINSAFGYFAMKSNTTGTANAAFGYQALLANTTGFSNTGIGTQALFSNTTGAYNTALGITAFSSNTTANKNTVLGTMAMTGQNYANSGTSYDSNNVAIGYRSLAFNNPTSDSNGIKNTAVGTESLISNTTGANNTGVGSSALFRNTTGANNIALGYSAGYYLTNGSYNIDIGHQGVAAEGNTIRIGTTGNQTKTFIAGINGVTPAGAALPVVIDGNGQLGTAAVNVGTTAVTGTLPVANGGTGASDAAGARTNLGLVAVAASGSYADLSGKPALATVATSGNYTDLTNRPTLGTAAALDVGIGNNKVVQLDASAKLPAVDGSQLTNTRKSDANFNTLFGSGAGASTTGQQNTAFGMWALISNTTGFANTGVGMSALQSNTIGEHNTAIGRDALANNATASDNVAIGSSALAGQSYDNGGVKYSSGNVAIGVQSLGANNPTSTSTGVNNTAVGFHSLQTNTTGANNIALGYNAGQNLTTGNYNIDVGNQGIGGEGNTIRIGDTNQTKTFIAGIRGVTTVNADAIPVVIDSNGQLGTVSSSIRYKEDVNDMGDLTSRLFGLRPVTFRYKTQPAAVHFGLIAEEVDQVMPELVVRGNDGQIETVAYHELTPMLLNELQKEHRINQEQDAAIQRLTAENAELKARLSKIEQALGL